MADRPERRIFKRTALLTKTVVLEHGYPIAEARIRNISQAGLGGAANEVLPRGMECAVVLPGIGEVAGTISWSSGTRFGLLFDTPIDLDDLHWRDLATARLPDRYTDKKRYREPTASGRSG